MHLARSGGQGPWPSPIPCESTIGLGALIRRCALSCTAASDFALGTEHSWRTNLSGVCFATTARRFHITPFQCAFLVALRPLEAQHHQVASQGTRGVHQPIIPRREAPISITEGDLSANWAATTHQSSRQCLLYSPLTFCYCVSRGCCSLGHDLVASCHAGVC